MSLLILAAVAAGQAQQKGVTAPTVMRGYVLQSDTGPSSTVIETPQQLAQFVATLPDSLPSKKQPAPTNPDPMRKAGFTIDFSKEVLVAVVHRDTISAYPIYKSFELGKKERVVKFDVPSPPPEARPYDWGVYTAVILPKVGVPTKIQKTDVEGDW